MTRNQTAAIALAFASLFAGQAMATNATTSTSRAQVQAELDEAKRTGNIIVNESGQRLNELYPHNFPEQQPVSTLTRAEVQADLDEAKRTGNFIVADNGQRLNEMYPHLYPTEQKTAGKTRQQVQDELAEAKRNGQFNTRITP